MRRVRGSAPNFVPRDCEAEARPADETAEAEQGQRSAFCKPAATGAAKAGNRNHQGEGISVPRLRAEMGSPWSVSFFDTLKILALQVGWWYTLGRTAVSIRDTLSFYYDWEGKYRI